MKKVVIIVVIILALVLSGVGAFFLHGSLYVSGHGIAQIPEHVALTPNALGTVTAVGRGLYDENGNRFDIKGINFGNLLIAEGWMTVNSVGASYNDDGTFQKVNEQGIVETYEEIYQEEMNAILAQRVERGDFSQEQLDALNDAYFYAYCTEADFQLIRDMGMNTIRLPMYYRNFMEGSDENLTMRADAFEKLDYFLELARKYGLKVILDMHGVAGGQSGYEHCGTRDMDFWETEAYIQAMCTLWGNIAEHYVNQRADLAATILAYDLVNEPTKRTESGTGKLQWDVMDRLYDAIRQVDDCHVISIEGVWFPTNLPDPADYGWENVLYQYHFYNWSHDKGIPNALYYGLMHGLYAHCDYEVPKLVGEFSFFADRDAWAKYLKQYDDLGWGWTVWSYKIVSVGYWDSSWGLVVHKLNLQNDPETPVEEYRLKLDIRTASYDEIMAAWSDQQTAYGGQEGVYQLYGDGTLYNVLKDYFGTDLLAED